MNAGWIEMKLDVMFVLRDPIYFHKLRTSTYRAVYKKHYMGFYSNAYFSFDAVSVFFFLYILLNIDRIHILLTTKLGLSHVQDVYNI